MCLIAMELLYYIYWRQKGEDGPIFLPPRDQSVAALENFPLDQTHPCVFSATNTKIRLDNWKEKNTKERTLVFAFLSNLTSVYSVL